MANRLYPTQNLNSRLRPALAVASALVLLLVPVQSAHGCYGELVTSVHFNSMNPDFGTPVRRNPKSWWDSKIEDDSDGYAARSKTAGAAVSSTRLDEPYDMNRDERREAKLADFNQRIARAREAEKRGNWGRAREIYLQCVTQRTHWTGDLRDSVEVMDLLLTTSNLSGTKRKAADRYLAAMWDERHGNWVSDKTTLNKLVKEPAAEFIKDHILYRLGSIAYTYMGLPEAAAYYQRVVRECQSSPKREEALIMLARLSILPDAPTQTDLRRGVEALHRLTKEYPNSRFARSAMGLKARVHFLNHRYSDALWCYYYLDNLSSARMVCDAMSPAQAELPKLVLLEHYIQRMAVETSNDEPTLSEIWKLRDSLTPNSVKLFSQHLRLKPELFAPYVYYRLYYSTIKPKDLDGLAATAMEVVRKTPNAPLNPLVEVRLAEIEYQRKHYKECFLWASRASRKRFASQDRAFFMKASAEVKQNRLHDAQADLQKVLLISKNTPVRTGTREQLAIVAERTGQLGLAADQYYELGYNLDLAYIIDVRMNSANLKHYLGKCVNADESQHQYYWRSGNPRDVDLDYTRKQALTYSLAIHYLRDEDFAHARACLLRLSRKMRKQFDTGRREFGSEPSPDALVAVNDLAQLKRKASSALGSEAKADAEYRYASYYHNNGALLLYDPILWNQRRVGGFEAYWNPGAQTDTDVVALRKYLQKHEVFLRSRQLCLNIAKKFPNTRTAPKALYRAACASSRSGALEGWSQNLDKKLPDLVPSGEAHDLLITLVRKYPHSDLVAAARKYASVFAANAQRSGWPHYAARSNEQNATAARSPRPISSAELDAMEHVASLGPSVP